MKRETTRETYLMKRETTRETYQTVYAAYQSLHAD